MSHMMDKVLPNHSLRTNVKKLNKYSLTKETYERQDMMRKAESILLYAYFKAAKEN